MRTTWTVPLTGTLATLLMATTPALGDDATPAIRRTGVLDSSAGVPALDSPLAIARDARSGDLIVSSFGAGKVVILSPAGAVLTTLAPRSKHTAFYGVAVADDGRIYASVLQTGAIEVFEPNGARAAELDLSATLGRPVAPGRITVRNHEIYVADLNGNEILVFTHGGDFVRAIGSLDYLQKAAPLDHRKVLGLSAQGTAVTIFDRRGKVVRSFGKHGDAGDKNMSFPTGFAVDAKRRLWIADAFQQRIKVFSLDGALLFSFGKPADDTGSGFAFPVDLVFGEHGALFVLEKGASRIQVFEVGDLVE